MFYQNSFWKISYLRKTTLAYFQLDVRKDIDLYIVKAESKEQTANNNEESSGNGDERGRETDDVSSFYFILQSPLLLRGRLTERLSTTFLQNLSNKPLKSQSIDKFNYTG